MCKKITNKAKLVGKLYATGFNILVLMVKKGLNKIDLDDYEQKYWGLVCECFDTSLQLVDKNMEGAEGCGWNKSIYGICRKNDIRIEHR